MRYIVFAFAASALLSSCDAPTPTDLQLPLATLTLGPASLASVSGAQVVFHDQDSTVVTGDLRLPGLPYSADAFVDMVPDEITLRLRARAEPGCCADAINSRPYRVRITGVFPGTTSIRVIHAYAPNTWAPDTMLTQPLTLFPSAQRDTP